MRRIAWRVAHLPLLAALVTIAACERTGPEAAPTSVPAAPVALPDDETPPEGVLRAYVWECDGGVTLRVRNLYREDAVSIELHEGARKLPRVVSASGAKYADDSVTFWSKGGTATFEREGSPAIHCSEARAKSLRADARLRGVTYRAQGNEPGWLVEIGPGTSLVLVADYGQERHEFDGITRSDEDGRSTVVFSGAQGPDAIKVTLVRETCRDDMSGEEFDHRAVVEFAGRELRGCGTALQ